MKTKVLISSCLLGCNVKYDGKNNCIDEKIIDKLKNKFELFSFCPEVEGGLPIPRIACEIITQNPLKIVNKIKDDKTNNFILGASKTLELCQKEEIKLAILKSNSPSCSNEYIYDGSFTGVKIKGFGVTTKLLVDNNIEVINETEINKLFN